MKPKIGCTIRDLAFLASVVAHNALGQIAIPPPNGVTNAARRLERLGLILKDPNGPGYIPTERGFKTADLLVDILERLP